MAATPVSPDEPLVARAMELPAVKIPASSDSSETDEKIRCFRLSAGGVTLELCCLGASITRLLLPSHSVSATDAGATDAAASDTGEVNDCVLGYASPAQMMESCNPTYLGVVVGRVANRVQGGKFRLKQRDNKVVTYTLDKNNGPNHLHGGVRGFGHRIWEAKIVDVPLHESDEGKTVPGVQFALTSDNGDQGYPGRVRVTATYSLRLGDTMEESRNDAVLRLVLRASLLSTDIASPINLAQHSYFNLSGHSHPNGVLDHVLSMPACNAYLAVDGTSIPTRDVILVEEDPAMDFRRGRVLREVLLKYGTEKAGRTEEETDEDIRSRQFPARVEPYGIDHCYVIGGESSSRVGDNGSPLNLAGCVEHPPTRRRMEVWTDAPGVQIYTANYLDKKSPGPDASKDGASYGPWQGVCLETQCYPDSILLDDERGALDGFSDGKCVILRPGGEDYVHNVEYIFGPTGI